MLRQYELVEKVRSYDPDADEGLINRAYVFSMKAHGAQKRASGDPYFSHPIEVVLADAKRRRPIRRIRLLADDGREVGLDDLTWISRGEVGSKAEEAA